MSRYLDTRPGTPLSSLTTRDIGEQRVCELCATPLIRRDYEYPSKYRRRRFCGNACSRRAQQIREIARFAAECVRDDVDRTLISFADRDGSIRGTGQCDLGEPLARAHMWYLGGDGYVHRRVAAHGQRCVSIKMHRELMGLERGDPRVVDHINGDTLDNRRSNLRVVTHAENLQNRQRLAANNTSGVRGVSFHGASGKFRAYATVGGRHFHLGLFERLDEAEAVVTSFRRANMPFSEADRAA